MRPRALLPAVALALVLFAVPALIPGAGAVDPVISASEYSTYRAWSSGIIGQGVTDRQYDSQASMVDLCSVTVDGFLLLNQPNGPYPSNGAPTLGSEFGTTADYYVCWLDENHVKRSLHVTENVGVTGGQANWGGSIFKTLYRDGWWLDDVPEHASDGSWIEDCHISLTRKDPVTYAYEKVATWHIGAAFSENIYLVAEYSLGSPEYKLSDPYNHPSVTKDHWNAVSWHGQYKYPAPASYDESMAFDWPRHDLILAKHSSDSITSRSALYGYATSLRDRMLSVGDWIGALDPVNGAGSLSKAARYLDAALDGTGEVMTGIASMKIAEIHDVLTDALRRYHLAILYADKAVIEDADYAPIGSPGDTSYLTVEEWRQVFIQCYLEEPIEELESQEGRAGFAAWLMGSANGLILSAAATALGIVALATRNGYAGLLTIGVFALSVIMWMRGG